MRTFKLCLYQLMKKDLKDLIFYWSCSQETAVCIFINWNSNSIIRASYGHICGAVNNIRKFHKNNKGIDKRFRYLPPFADECSVSELPSI